MARIFSVLADDADGVKRELWVAEDDTGVVIGSGADANTAAFAAYNKLRGCAEIAQRRGLPSRYVRRLLAEAERFRPAGVNEQSGT